MTGKKILAIYYSQSGQLAEIIHQFILPLEKAGASVEVVRVQLSTSYPFPWTSNGFFSVMPDSVRDVPVQIEPIRFKEEAYDLIVLGYQAWFLSPSIPFNSFMQNNQLQSLLNGTPVITLTGARNMWLSAFVRVKKLLKIAGANHVGNIALVDTHPNPVSFITIFHWMLHGKKDRYLNIFPPPGVSDSDIKHTSVFGQLALPHLENNNWDTLQHEMVKQGAVKLNYNLMIIEGTAAKIFAFWARFISGKKNKLPWIKVFKYYLLVAFFIGAPIVITIDGILFRFFAPKRTRTKKLFYLKLN